MTFQFGLISPHEYGLRSAQGHTGSEKVVASWLRVYMWLHVSLSVNVSTRVINFKQMLQRSGFNSVFIYLFLQRLHFCFNYKLEITGHCAVLFF